MIVQASSQQERSFSGGPVTSILPTQLNTETRFSVSQDVMVKENSGQDQKSWKLRVGTGTDCFVLFPHLQNEGSGRCLRPLPPSLNVCNTCSLLPEQNSVALPKIRYEYTHAQVLMMFPVLPFTDLHLQWHQLSCSPVCFSDLILIPRNLQHPNCLK